MKNFFIVMADCEIVYEGTREECINYYRKLPNPIEFRLLDIRKVYKIWRNFGSKIVNIKEDNENEKEI